MGGDAVSPADAGAAEDSAVTQDYLKAVWVAVEMGGVGASVTGLARRMGVAPSTASENVARLVEAGLLEHDPYRPVTLSPEGRRRAMAMVRRHRLLETYLVEVLGFEWDEVHAEAEVLEHAVSDRLLDRLDAALGHPERDPHGDPIPSADGRLPDLGLDRLESCRVGGGGVVGRIRDDGETLRALGRAGIGLDTALTVTGRTTLPAVGSDRDGSDSRGLREAGLSRGATVVRVRGQGDGPEAVVPDGAVWLRR